LTARDAPHRRNHTKEYFYQNKFIKSKWSGMKTVQNLDQPTKKVYEPLQVGSEDLKLIETW
jgi:hypothetical protein